MANNSHIESISAADAFARARRNNLRRFPAPDRDGERLYPLASPTANPSFEIEAEDTIFAIGSCFARNVERALEGAGKRVLSREFELGEIGESLADAANFFNKYSIHSVVNEVRWALERDTFPGEEILYPLGKGRYSDAQLGMGRLDFSVDQIMEFRHRYLDAMAAVAEADVIILTLGYVETWYDTKLGLYANIAPPGGLIRDEPDRFEFRVLSYGDVLEGLEEFYSLLQKHRTKPMKMLITVSPVPLLATFRDMDVLVANAYSKSVQRAALDQFLVGKEGVDYFPSYEFVTLSNPTVAWSNKDYRHVSPNVVNRIMSDVLTRYIPGEHANGAEAAMTPDALLSSLRMMAKLENYKEVVALADANRELTDNDTDALLTEAVAYRRMNDLENSWKVLQKAYASEPTRYDPLERMIMLTRPLKLKTEAKRLLSEHEATFPGRGHFREKVTWI